MHGIQIMEKVLSFENKKDRCETIPREKWIQVCEVRHGKLHGKASEIRLVEESTRKPDYRRYWEPKAFFNKIFADGRLMSYR